MYSLARLLEASDVLLHDRGVNPLLCVFPTMYASIFPRECLDFDIQLGGITFSNAHLYEKGGKKIGLNRIHLCSLTVTFRVIFADFFVSSGRTRYAGWCSVKAEFFSKNMLTGERDLSSTNGRAFVPCFNGKSITVHFVIRVSSVPTGAIINLYRLSKTIAG